MSDFVFASDIQKKFFESEEEFVMFGGGYGSYGKPSPLTVMLAAAMLSLQHGEPRPSKTLPRTD